MTASADGLRTLAEMSPDRGAKAGPSPTRHDQGHPSLPAKRLNPAQRRGVELAAGPQHQAAQPFRQPAQDRGWIGQPVAIGKYP